MCGQSALSLLHKLAILLESGGDLRHILDGALELMARELGMMRGAMTLIDPKTGGLRIEASWGLNTAQKKRGAYARGEGITGRVIASGQSMLVADVSREPLFLNKTRSRDLAREKISFLCAPIKLNGQVVGALSADQLPASPGALDEELKLLEVIAALLAPAACERQETMEEAPGGTARPPGFIGSSEKILQIYDQIAVVAPSQTTVLLHGESGTGKELAARAIHKQSARKDGPFVSLNCAALPENLIESELFGHERGAFTGASQRRLGRFELANGGTLFLDEIGELSLPVQAKLLRVLQEKTFERLGGMETVKGDARLVAATNRDLAAMAASGAFRRDLFYRLNVFPIHMPPLRERREDIEPLAAAFLEQLARRDGKKTPRLSLGAMELLHAWPWPGNIRELRNVMERAMLLAGSDSAIAPRHLPPQMRANLKNATRESPAARLDSRLAGVEKTCVINALKASRGRINKAADILGLTTRKLALRLKKYGIDYKTFRSGEDAARAD